MAEVQPMEVDSDSSKSTHKVVQKFPSEIESITFEGMAPNMDATSIGRPNTPIEKQILPVQWLLATPDSYRSVADRFNISKGTLRLFVNKFVGCLSDMAPQFIRWPRPHEMLSIRKQFYVIARFDEWIIGAIDGTFVVIPAPKEVAEVFRTHIREHCRLIERAESSKEFRLINRVLRSLITTRRRLTNNVLWRLINYYFTGPGSSKQKTELLSYLRSPKDDSAASEFGFLQPLATVAPTTLKSPRQQRRAEKSVLTGSSLPEVEAYLHLLLVLFLMEEKRFLEAEKCINYLLKRLVGQNRRSMDPLAAKVYYFYSIIEEKLNKLADCVPFFQSRLRLATLRHDEDSQATLINCLLRTHLNGKDFEMAGFLIVKTNFPLSANTNMWARYHFHVGRIKATELQYSEAKQALQLALRKAPQHTAVGFRQAAQKFLVTVELLMGVVPERSLFRQSIYRKPLTPYLQLAQAVRVGNVSRFDEMVQKYADQFERDGTYTLVVRLRQNVIRTAVRQISLAYSRISVVDIQKNKLQLTHPDDAEYIVAKAIRNGVIDAEINHAEGYVQCKECGDLYSTPVPQIEYDVRIRFCLDIYNQAVKAMRFPPKSYAKDLETSEEKREREQQELEFAKEMADEDEDFS